MIIAPLYIVMDGSDPLQMTDTRAIKAKDNSVCVGRSRNAGRWGENKVRLEPSQTANRWSARRLPTYRWSRKKNSYNPKGDEG